MSVYTYSNGFAVGQSINKINANIDFYNIGGCVNTLFGSQLTKDFVFLEIETNNNLLKTIQLKFISTPIANKELPTGKLTIRYLESGSWSTYDILTGLELNHTRNFSAFRNDVIHWKYESSTNTTFSVWFYNLSGEKVFSGIETPINKIITSQTDSIHYII